MSDKKHLAKELLLGPKGICMMCKHLRHPTPHTYMCSVLNARIASPLDFTCHNFLDLTRE